MKKIAGLLFISILIPFLGLACSCIGEETVKDAIKKADVVLVGRVIKSEQFEIPSALPKYKMYRIRHTLSIQKLYKGKIKTEKIEIITGVGNGDCGFQFQEGEVYIIYSNWESKYHNYSEPVEIFLTTNICTRTTKLNQAEVAQIESFKKAKKF